MSAVPTKGKTYKYFDDGKLSPSRRYDVLITDVVKEGGVDKDTLALWKRDVEDCDFLYSKETDFFVKGTLEDDTKVVFVRVVDGGWFSLGWFAGRLDIDGSITKRIQ